MTASGAKDVISGGLAIEAFDLYQGCLGNAALRQL
jgi:hypothetical protein